jgi:hypothetical protein
MKKRERNLAAWLARENMAWLAIVVLHSSLATAASAQSVIDRLRGCLAIEDMTKARLDCYDAIVPPVIEDCRFFKKEDERLICFNQFLALPVKPYMAEVPPSVTQKPKSLNKKRPTKKPKDQRGREKCSTPGSRLPNGKCAKPEGTK